MPSLVLMLDGATVKEVALVKPRTTLGRRPSNDVVIDNLAISGQHAVIHMQGEMVEVEDLNSTNGTFVNGQPVQRRTLHHGDMMSLGRYEVRFIERSFAASARAPLYSEGQSAFVHVLSGPGAGREVALSKVVTTLGKPGVMVASITRRPHGFVLAHVEGDTPPRVNGHAMDDPRPLRDGDRITLAEVEMEFLLR